VEKPLKNGLRLTKTNLCQDAGLNGRGGSRGPDDLKTATAAPSPEKYRKPEGGEARSAFGSHAA
jgi:hypothetical protein